MAPQTRLYLVMSTAVEMGNCQITLSTDHVSVLKQFKGHVICLVLVYHGNVTPCILKRMTNQRMIQLAWYKWAIESKGRH